MSYVIGLGATVTPRNISSQSRPDFEAALVGAIAAGAPTTRVLGWRRAFDLTKDDASAQKVIEEVVKYGQTWGANKARGASLVYRFQQDPGAFIPHIAAAVVCLYVVRRVLS